MNKKLKLLLASAVCVIGIFGESTFDAIKNISPAKITVKIDEPSIEYKTLVQPVVETSFSSEDSDLLFYFYSEMADIINTDKEFIQTTEQFRKFNMFAGELYFNTKLKDKYENLGEDIDNVIVQSIGKESVSLDSSKREKLVQTLNALSWGVKQ
jgi:hypothetical protein